MKIKDMKVNGNTIEEAKLNGQVVYKYKSDIIPPTITVKTGESETIGDLVNKIFSKVSFKLYDNVGLKEYELNGAKGQLSVSQWSDINNVTINFKGAVLGLNKLIVRDTSGNETLYEFILIEG